MTNTLTGLRLGFCLPGNEVCSKRLCFPLCLPRLQRHEWVCPPSAGSCKAARARKSLTCLEINAAQWKATAWEWMRGRKGKGRGNKGKRGKEQVLYQKKAIALNLDLSCSYLKEHACNKWLSKRVRPSQAESWGYLPSFSMAAVLSIQICTHPAVSLGWASVLPQAQGSAAACANRGNGASMFCYAAIWGAIC